MVTALNRTSERGISNFVDDELRDDMLGFNSFLRMGSSEFNDNLNEIAGYIMRMDTVMRDSVTPKELYLRIKDINFSVSSSVHCSAMFLIRQCHRLGQAERVRYSYVITYSYDVSNIVPPTLQRDWSSDWPVGPTSRM